MNQLVEITQNAPKTVSVAIIDGLQKFFADAEKQKEVIDSIVVTKPDQVVEMKQAREIRLKIKNSRLEARDVVKSHRENLKSAMSEFTLQDKLWLKAFQMLEATCDKLESDCEYKEKFAERYEAEQKQLRYESRVSKLHQFGTDPSIYALADMSDDAFEKLLDNERLAYEARLAAEKKATEDRIAKEKAEAEAQEAIRIENARLKAEALEKERLAAIEAKKRDEALSRERAEQQKKLEAERKAREEAESKIKAEKIAQEQKIREEKVKAEALQKAQEEEARKKLLAPDKEKLMELAQIIDQIQLPAVLSKEANSVVRATEDMLGKVTNYIREKAKTL